MDPTLLNTASIIEQQLTLLGRLDGPAYCVAVESLGVTDDKHKMVFYVIVRLYKIPNDTLKFFIVELIATIVPYANTGVPVEQLSPATLWELFVKLWKVVERVPFVKAMDRLRHLLALIWGDEFAKDIPFTVKEALLHLGFTAEELPTLTLEEFVKRVCDTRPQTSIFERLRVTLDLLFEARYNWPQGTAESTKPQDLVLALEHALEYTPKDRPSIWDITKA
jgi:hypothetical protein